MQNILDMKLLMQTIFRAPNLSPLVFLKARCLVPLTAMLMTLNSSSWHRSFCSDLIIYLSSAPAAVYLEMYLHNEGLVISLENFLIIRCDEAWSLSYPSVFILLYLTRFHRNIMEDLAISLHGGHSGTYSVPSSLEMGLTIPPSQQILNAASGLD